MLYQMRAPRLVNPSRFIPKFLLQNITGRIVLSFWLLTSKKINTNEPAVRYQFFSKGCFLMLWKPLLIYYCTVLLTLLSNVTIGELSHFGFDKLPATRIPSTLPVFV